MFELDMQWGSQPVRLTALRSNSMPLDAPVTSVHVVPLYGGRVLVVCDRRGVFGYPGGRLELEESWEAAMSREVYEEAAAYINPGYIQFGMMRIECTEKLPGRNYPHPYTYMALYAGTVRAMEPIRRDPAGIVTSRALFTLEECKRNMQRHDVILLREALIAMARQPNLCASVCRFLNTDRDNLVTALRALKEI